MPLRWQYRLADLIAWIIANTRNQLSTQARQNIRLCFADLNPDQQQRLYRDSIRHTCYAMTELGTIWYRPVERLMEMVTSIDICPEYHCADQGRLVLAPHLGSWEMLAQWLGKTDNAIFLYKRRKNHALDQFIVDCRARTGGEPVSTRKGGLRQLLIGLRNNRTLMILPDQRPRGKHAYADSIFFGLDAPTTTLVNSLCSKLECRVFIATMYRSTPVGEFGLRIISLDREPLSGEQRQSVNYMNAAIEQLVRDYPGQYQWGYRRFRSSVYQSLLPES